MLIGTVEMFFSRSAMRILAEQPENGAEYSVRDFNLEAVAMLSKTRSTLLYQNNYQPMTRRAYSVNKEPVRVL